LEKIKKGPVWHAKVVTEGVVKPMRAMPTITASELLDGLVRRNGRWIFPYPLNGWPGLVDLELRSLTCNQGGFVKNIKRIWTVGDSLEAPDLLAASSIPKRTRATLIASAWTEKGWSEDSPGFVWWFTHEKNILHGEGMAEKLKASQFAAACALRVYHFAHRYSVQKETVRDQQTWHTGVIIEWSHGAFVTLCELAWLNGCGGYWGKSNWVEDKLETPTQLYVKMLDSMKCPWDIKKSEIRVLDMPCKSIEDFRAYLHKYSEAGELPFDEQRFLKPIVFDSLDIRIHDVTPAALATYLLNYIYELPDYVELQPSGASNCQTFAADLFSFLSGKRDAKPYGKIVQAMYKRRSDAFLYRPS